MMSSIVWHLTENLLIVAALTPLVWAACRWWHDRPAIQHALWTVLLIKLILPPLVHWPGPPPREWLTAFSSFLSHPTPAAHSNVAAGGLANVAKQRPSPATSTDASVNPTRRKAQPIDAKSADSQRDRQSPVTTGPSSVQSRQPARTATQAPVHRDTVPLGAMTSPQRRAVEAVSPAAATTAKTTAQATETAKKFISADPDKSSTDRSWPWLGILVAAVWIGGGLITGLRQALRLVHHWRIVRRATPAPAELQHQLRQVAQRMRTRPVPLSVVAGISSPLVWCLGRVQMLWPRRLATANFDERFRAVMAHELAHIRRRDHWIAWLELAAGLIWWWNPLFWWIRHRLRDAAEMACDAEALRVWPEDRHVYAETFLELSLSSRNGAPVPVLGVSTGAHQSFRRRLSMMLSERVSGKITAAGFLAATVLTLAAMPTWSWGQNPSDGAPAQQRAAEEALQRAKAAYRDAIEQDQVQSRRQADRNELDQVNQRLQILERSLDRIAKIAETTQLQAARERADLQQENDRRLKRLEAVLSRLDRRLQGDDRPANAEEANAEEANAEEANAEEGNAEEGNAEEANAEEDHDEAAEHDDATENKEHASEDRDGDDHEVVEAEAKHEAEAEAEAEHEAERRAEDEEQEAAERRVADDLRAHQRSLEKRQHDVAEHLQSVIDEALQRAGIGKIREEAQAEIQRELRDAMAEAQQELESAAREIQDELHAEYRQRFSDEQRHEIEALAAEAAEQAQQVARDAQQAAKDALAEAQRAASSIVQQAEALAKQKAERDASQRQAPMNLKWHNQQGELTLTDEQTGRVVARLRVSGDQRIELDGTRLMVSGPDGQAMLLELSAPPSTPSPSAPGSPLPPTPPDAPPSPPTAPGSPTPHPEAITYPPATR